MSYPLLMSAEQAQALLKSYDFVADISFLQHAAGLSLREMFATILSKVSEGVFVLDANLCYVCVNEQFLQITQLDRELILGRYFSYYPIESFTKSRYTLFSRIEKRLQQHLPVNEHFALWKPHGGEVFIRLQIHYYHVDSQCLPIYIGVVTNFDQYKQMYQAVSRQLSYDKLTGLQQRDSFFDMLTMTVKVADDEPVPLHVILLRINIDKLQAFNESLGIEATDVLIQSVVKRIQNLSVANVSVRGFSRFGGDNFGLLLSTAELSLAYQYVEALQSAFELPFSIGKELLYVRISVGVSAFPDIASDVEALLMQVEAALKQARLSGGDNIVWYQPSANQPAPRIMNTHLKSAFKKALQDNQIKAFFQPKIQFKQPDKPIFEALVRWQHPILGMINPHQFLDEVLETLSHELFEEILQQSIEQLIVWKTMGYSAVVCINVDGRQLRSPRFLNFVEEQLAKYECFAKHIEFELTEITELLNNDGALAGLQRLHDAGVRLAIDDFGTGYSSLSYLVTYPIDTIKLDKLFITDIETDPTKQILVKAVIAMAHTMDIEVVAEGVETEAALAFLRSPEVNCDGAQGYIYGKPMPKDQATQWMQQRFLPDPHIARESLERFGELLSPAST